MSKLTGQEIIEILEDSLITKAHFVDGYEFPTVEQYMTTKFVSLHFEEANKYNNLNYKELHEIPEETRPQSRKFEMLSQYLDFLGLGECNSIVQEGGEDCGSTYFGVSYFPKHDVHIRCDGFYQSYNGVDYEYGAGYSVVSPVVREVTFYE